MVDVRAVKVEIDLREDTKAKVAEIAELMHLEFDETLRHLILLGVEIKERQLEDSPSSN